LAVAVLSVALIFLLKLFSTVKELFCP